ncbi:MAG: DUF1156 domain-containing protein [Candidatus Bathyarchaeota archaeon]|nr:DUF1156 domain-containing protein [Candidatus Bathyarchaeota archaeon]
MTQTSLNRQEAFTPPAGRRFIESPKFPFREVSEASAVEKGPGRPPHWEMVFWWTRKPLISARALIAGALLPEDTGRDAFLRLTGIHGKKRAAHLNPPLTRFPGVKLLDPFAGFGSIPLEAMRLGLDATAVDLLPVSYVFLKAVLEYPAKYGRKLVADVEKWGKWVTDQLQQDPLIKELYEPDVAVYIGSWEIKCPHCGRWTPIVGNWWLARVKGKEGYERLAWMEPAVEGDEAGIRVVDLNRRLGEQAVRKAKVSGVKVTANGREYRVPESNINARRETAICLLCSQPIMQVDTQTGRHYVDVKSLPRNVKDRLLGYVKHAIKTYNQSLEQDGVESLARQRLLVKVKVKEGDLEFEPCTEKEKQKLEKANQEMKNLMDKKDPDMPIESLWPYVSTQGGRLSIIIWGFNKFYKLFNSRQLLTLVKLVKLIREAGKKIEEEKQKEGQTKEEAQRYAEAITALCSIALSRYSEHSSLATPWNSSTGLGSVLALKPSNVMSFRGIAMTWNWCDTFPVIDFAGSFNRALKTSVQSLLSLSFSYSINQMVNKTTIFLDNATILSRIPVTKRFTLIVTDPPYYDDVPYAELSDFYYVWLKRALSDVEDGKLVPRFLPEAFFEKVGDDWTEVSTQWEKFALSEVSVEPPRLGVEAKQEDGIRHFQRLLNASFVSMSRKLADDGLLITYYAHTDPDAWKALLEAGWMQAGLRVTNAFPLTTESAQSIVSRGKLSMDTSIVVVWRKGTQGTVQAAKLYDEMVEAAAARAALLMQQRVYGRDLFINVLATALAEATQYKSVVDMAVLDTASLVDRYVYPAACIGLTRSLARQAELADGIRSPDAMFYLIVKTLLSEAKPKALESTTLRLLAIGTSLDVKAAQNSWRLLRSASKAEEEGGAKIAKAGTLILLEPEAAERNAVASLLEQRGVGLAKPNIRCAVDALHLLEYYAATYPASEYKLKLELLRAAHPAAVEEALALSKVLAAVLPEADAEKTLSKRVIEPLLG